MSQKWHRSRTRRVPQSNNHQTAALIVGYGPCNVELILRWGGRVRARSATMAAASKRTLAWEGSSFPRSDWCAWSGKIPEGLRVIFGEGMTCISISACICMYLYVHAGLGIQCIRHSISEEGPFFHLHRRVFKITQSGWKPFWDSI